MKQKLTTVLLALVFMLTAFPMAIFAEEGYLADSESWITVENGEQLITAMSTVSEGTIIKLQPGNYNVTTAPDADGKYGSGMIVSQSNITIEAADPSQKPVIYGFSNEFNAGVEAGKNGQDTIYVSGDNVTLRNLKIMPLGGVGENANDWQKTVEVVAGADGFKMEGCETLPNTMGQGNSMSASAGLIHISTDTAVLMENHFGAGTKICAGWKASSGGAVTEYYKVTANENFGEPALEGIVVVDGKAYVTDEAALRQAVRQDSEFTEVALANDIALDKMLIIEKSLLHLDMKGKVITASHRFTGPGENDRHLVQIGKENAPASDVVLENGTLKATEANKNTLNIYQSKGVQLINMTLEHKGFKGAPLIVNASEVTVSGKLSLIVGENSWYGINLDDKGTNASLTFGNGSSVTMSGRNDLSAIQVDGNREASSVVGAESAGLKNNGNGIYIIAPKPTPDPGGESNDDHDTSAPVATPSPVATPAPTATARPATVVSHAKPTATPAATAQVPTGAPVVATTQVEATVTENTAAVTVESKQLTDTVNQVISDAKESDGAPAVKVEVAAAAEATAIEVRLPAQALDTLAKAPGATFTVTSSVAEVTFDNTALTSIVGQADEEIVLVVSPVAAEEMSDAQAEKVNGYPTFELILQSGDKVISDFNQGKATVTLPHVLAEGQQAEGVVVWYVEDNGNTTVCETTYDVQTQKVTFVTPHFSRYAIAYDETLVAGQTDAELPLAQEPVTQEPARESGISMPVVIAIAVVVILVMVLVGRLFFAKRDSDRY